MQEHLYKCIVFLFLNYSKKQMSFNHLYLIEQHLLSKDIFQEITDLCYFLLEHIQNNIFYIEQNKSISVFISQ